MTSPTDTNQASELYELCKKVYKRTGWEAPETYKAEDGNPENDWQAYDTDYLLEKLPPALFIYSSKEGMQLVHLLEVCMQGDGQAYARYVIPYDTEFRGSYQNKADTPLKALLKLTLRLHEEKKL